MKDYSMKSFIALISALIAICCTTAVYGKPMPPTQSAFGAVSKNMQAAGARITAREVEESKTSDQGRKSMLKKMIVTPLEDAGFDIDSTLEDFATRLQDQNYTESEGTVITASLAIFGETAADLARFGFIKQSTLGDLGKVYTSQKELAEKDNAKRELEHQTVKSREDALKAVRSAQDALEAAENVLRKFGFEDPNTAVENAKQDIQGAQHRLDVAKASAAKPDANSAYAELVVSLTKELPQYEAKYAAAVARIQSFKVDREKAEKALQIAKSNLDQANKDYEAANAAYKDARGT